MQLAGSLPLCRNPGLDRGQHMDVLHWLPSPCGAMVTEEPGLVVSCIGRLSGKQNGWGFMLQGAEDGE